MGRAFQINSLLLNVYRISFGTKSGLNNFRLRICEQLF